jgi:5-hydroxyisourate hydrolase-like protein (transthyretin family)
MVLATLLILPQGMLPSSASPESTKYLISVSPTRIQEGLDTNTTLNLYDANASTTYTYKLNVTSPSGDSYFANVTVTTDETGVGSNMTEFLSDFADATTKYVGTYNVAVNGTLATSNFTVGLTDKLRYLRSETVDIRGSGYAPNETVIVDLKFGSSSVSTFPFSINASSEGVVTSSWQIPADATLGVYTLSISNATADGTVKTPADVQTFNVEGICEIQVRNLASQTVAGVSVEVWNATSGKDLNMKNATDDSGLVKFSLGVGNYTFKAFLTHLGNEVKIGERNWTFTGDATLPLSVNLSNLKLLVQDAKDTPIPFTDLNLTYNYTTRDNETIQEPPTSFITPINGTVILQNVFTNISYRIEARRYGFLFNITSIPNLPPQDWNNITIIAPTCTMVVHMLDSTDKPAVGLDVKAYEWSSGISEALQSNQTDSNGNATFSFTFGRYRLKMYNDTTFVSESTVDLVQNPLFLVIRLDIYKVNLTVLVVDYFGQPLPNASIEFQRKINSNYETAQTRATESNGVASFTNVIGGDSRVYASVAGSPSEAQYLYLADSKQITFRFDGYVSVVGYALETSQFVTVIILLIIIVAFAIASTYKRLGNLLQRRRK